MTARTDVTHVYSPKRAIIAVYRDKSDNPTYHNTIPLITTEWNEENTQNYIYKICKVTRAFVYAYLVTYLASHVMGHVHVNDPFDCRRKKPNDVIFI